MTDVYFENWWDKNAGSTIVSEEVLKNVKFPIAKTLKETINEFEKLKKHLQSAHKINGDLGFIYWLCRNIKFMKKLGLSKGIWGHVLNCCPQSKQLSTCPQILSPDSPPPKLVLEFHRGKGIEDYDGGDTRYVRSNDTIVDTDFKQLRSEIDDDFDQSLNW